MIPNSITFDLSGISPTIIGGSDGKLVVSNIQGYSNINNMLMEVYNQSGVTIFSNKITGNTTLYNLSVGTTGITYTVNIYDLGTINIPTATNSWLLTSPKSKLKLYNVQSTSSGLNPNFVINLISPTSIRINKNDIGLYFGIPMVGITPYGGSITSWQLFDVNNQVNFNSGIAFSSPYSIVVRDSGSTFDFRVQRDLVTVNSPLNTTFSTSQNSDTGGTYINVSNYLTTIIPSSNPIVGQIEMSIYLSTSLATNWISGDNISTPKKLYVNGTGSYKIDIRERYNNIIMYVVTKSITIV
jgi:hypothetical protein